MTANAPTESNADGNQGGNSPPNFKNIPAELREQPTWVCYDPPSKIPLDPKENRNASTTDPETWASFDIAASMGLGIGYVFTGNGNVGIDLDGCRNPETGELDARAQAIKALCNSYTEVSPSGRGLHIFIKATLDRPGLNKGGIEIYDRERYFTVTGDWLPDTPATVEERQDVLNQLLEEYFPTPGGSSTSSNPPGWLAELLRDGSPDGQRNNDGMKIAGALVAMGVYADVATVILRGWGEKSKCDPATLDADIAGWLERSRVAEAAKIAAAAEDAAPEPEAKREPWSPSTPEGSFISRYVAEASARTDAPSEVHEAIACMLLSFLAGPNVKIPLAVPVGGMPLLLWMLYLSNSSLGRKSTALGLGEYILARVAPRRSLDWDSSPQALIEFLQVHDGEATTWLRDEVAPLFMQINARNGAGYLGALPGTLCRVYDCQPLENRRTKKGKGGERQDDSPRVESPYHLLLWAGTYDRTLDHIGVADVLTGFLARFAIITATVTEPRPLSKATPEMMAEQERLIEAARGFMAKCALIRNVDLTPEALDAWSKIEIEWQAVAAQNPDPSTAAPLLKRSSDMIIKLASLIAIDLSPERTGVVVESEIREGFYPAVTADHVAMAEAIVRRWRDSGLRVLADLGRTRYQKDVADVRATVTRRGTMPIRDVLRAHPRINGRYMTDILDHLAKMEYVTLFDGEKPIKGFAPKMVRVRRS